MVMSVKNSIFWDVSPCSLAEDGGSMFLQNVVNFYQTTQQKSMLFTLLLLTIIRLAQSKIVDSLLCNSSFHLLCAGK